MHDKRAFIAAACLLHWTRLQAERRSIKRRKAVKEQQCNFDEKFKTLGLYASPTSNMPAEAALSAARTCARWRKKFW